MYYLSIACIAKDEHLYLEEWVNYHRAVGVEYFYIYDNDSAIPISETLKNYIKQNIVKVIPISGKYKQIEAYRHCLSNFKTQSEWIAFIDCDEFILPKQNDDIKIILNNYKEYGALAANWLIFGPNNLNKKPEGLVIENFTKSSNKNWCLNNHIKSIVNTKYVNDVISPHHFRYQKTKYAVSEKYKKIYGGATFKCIGCKSSSQDEKHLCGEVSTNIIQINHYYTKSYEEFMVRHKKGCAFTKSNTRSSEHFFHAFNRICDQDNKEILKFVDNTKQLFI